jgi:hypothetical protein
MVPMLKLHPSLVEILVVPVVNGTGVDVVLLPVFVILLFQTYGSMTYSDVKLCKNALYSNIFSYILIINDDVISCMYCGMHVDAPDLFFK